MTTRIELRVSASGEELVIHVEAPGLLPLEPTRVEASVEEGVLEVRVPHPAHHVAGFHPEASPV